MSERPNFVVFIPDQLRVDGVWDSGHSEPFPLVTGVRVLQAVRKFALDHSVPETGWMRNDQHSHVGRGQRRRPEHPRPFRAMSGVLESGSTSAGTPNSEALAGRGPGVTPVATHSTCLPGGASISPGRYPQAGGHRPATNLIKCCSHMRPIVVLGRRLIRPGSMRLFKSPLPGQEPGRDQPECLSSEDFRIILHVSRTSYNGGPVVGSTGPLRPGIGLQTHGPNHWRLKYPCTYPTRPATQCD